MKNILITGASSGLGKSLAQLLKNDYRIFSASRTDPAIDGVTWIQTDLTKIDDLEKLIKYFLDNKVNLDSIILNAGTWIQGKLIDNDAKNIKELIELNLISQILLTQKILQINKVNSPMQFIYINSQAGLYTKAERSVYNSSKWGLTAFVKCMQQEYAKTNVKFTSVHPGAINTRLFEKTGYPRDTSQFANPDELAGIIKYIVDIPENLNIPEIGIVDIKY